LKCICRFSHKLSEAAAKYRNRPPTLARLLSFSLRHIFVSERSSYGNIKPNRIQLRWLLVMVIALASVGVVKAQTPTPSVTATPSPSATVSPSPSPSPSATKSPAQSTATPSPVDIRAKLLESNWYPLVISLLFAVLLLGFAATIARVILRSKSSFRSPLGLPEGSLRAMLAFLLVAFLGFYVYASVLSLSDFKLPDALLGIIATVIGFYFGSRSVEGAGAGANRNRPAASTGQCSTKTEHLREAQLLSYRKPELKSLRRRRI
jgi:hypothetical protein